MTPEVVSHFLSLFRGARAAALANAEGFRDAFIVLEQFGQHLLGKQGRGFGDYKEDLILFARYSPLFIEADDNDLVDTPFERLFDIVRIGRNDAIHEGASARHLTNNVVKFCIVLEHALMKHGRTLRDLMITDPVTVSFWQRLRAARQCMLANSFSNLPVKPEEGVKGTWSILTDHALAAYLKSADSEVESERTRLDRTLRDAYLGGDIKLIEVEPCSPDRNIDELTQGSGFDGRPILVTNDRSELVGLLTAYDLL